MEVYNYDQHLRRSGRGNVGELFWNEQVSKRDGSTHVCITVHYLEPCRLSLGNRSDGQASHLVTRITGLLLETDFETVLRSGEGIYNPTYLAV